MFLTLADAFDYFPFDRISRSFDILRGLGGNRNRPLPSRFHPANAVEERRRRRDIRDAIDILVEIRFQLVLLDCRRGRFRERERVSSGRHDGFRESNALVVSNRAMMMMMMMMRLCLVVRDAARGRRLRPVLGDETLKRARSVHLSFFARVLLSERREETTLSLWRFGSNFPIPIRHSKERARRDFSSISCA